jgi:hypothetical protein
VRRVGSMIILACHLRIIGRRLGPSVPCGSRAHLPRSVANPPGVFLTRCAAIPRLKPFSAPIHQNRPSHMLGPLPSLLSVKLPGGLSRCYSDRTLRRNARQRFLFESAMYGMP